MPQGLLHFFSNNVVLTVLAVILLAMFLMGKVTKLIVRGFLVVLLIMILGALAMAAVQKGRTAAGDFSPRKLLMWAVGKLGGAGGQALGKLDNGANDQQTGFRSCLFDAFQHIQGGKPSEAMVTALRRQCPDISPANQDDHFEMCMKQFLQEYDPNGLSACQSKYESPAGMTHSLMKTFCGWFPSVCGVQK